MISNPCKQKTNRTMKTVFLGVIVASIVGCGNELLQNNAQSSTSHSESVSSDKRCDILSGNNWSVRFASAQEENANSLIFSADVTMPTPGYKFEMLQGPLNRRHPPDLIVHIITQAPTDMVIQMISEEPFEGKLEQALDHYQRISVQCGDEMIAEFLDVVRDDH